MIGHLLQESAIWRARTGQDRHGKALLAADTVIACRWEWKRRIVKSQAGQDVVSEGRAFVTAPMSVGDHIVDPLGRAWTILAVSPHAGLGGRELYREVYI